MSNTPASPFANRVRNLRRERGLTQQQLAERAGMTYQYVSKIETGERGHCPTLDIAARLAKALGVNVAELVG